MKRVYLQKKNSTLEGYRLVDMEIFHNIISSLVCPECYGAFCRLRRTAPRKKGLASFIIISCNDFDFQTETYTSKTVQRSEEVVKGMMPLEVNIRSVYALRSCGVGRTGWDDEYADTDDSKKTIM